MIHTLEPVGLKIRVTTEQDFDTYNEAFEFIMKSNGVFKMEDKLSLSVTKPEEPKPKKATPVKKD